ncbi:hypothetical protein APR04_001728 [Promicromonospora umidemergens]|uniref:Uncharacterized protein n=1 Tax=Promicromonospora umidemergens TaxID=629679 RepID=A0ABP8XEQ7_9MICO|nr:hypothetical protein [Promicromonospora umidemergens]MCP2282825.1 hypothetical protein [Promicromonospora umidemergens]
MTVVGGGTGAAVHLLGMNASRTPQLNTGSVSCQAGPFYLSLQHVGDDQDADGNILHQYQYLVTNERSTGQRYEAADLHNRGVVDPDAALCYLIGHLYAIGRTVQNYTPDPDDDSMDHLPPWLQQAAAAHVDDLHLRWQTHEELLTGPTDLTFDFDDPET